jgi:hypothetical protein
MSNDGDGDMVYYSVDLWLSAYGLFRHVQKPGAVELFRRDPINYEVAFRQAGKLALSLEVLVDLLTIDAMFSRDVVEH